MREVEQIVVKRIVKRMVADAMKQMSPEYFLILKYKAMQFRDMIDADSFKAILGFLPNIKHNSQTFVLSVSHNKGNGEFELTVVNPRIKA